MPYQLLRTDLAVLQDLNNDPKKYKFVDKTFHPKQSLAVSPKLNLNMAANIFL